MKEIDEEHRKLEAKLYKEFFKFIAPLNLNSELYRYIRNYAITGECCWELEVDPDNEDAGVIGFRFLPTHSYDYAYDVNTKKKVGIYVKILQTQYLQIFCQLYLILLFYLVYLRSLYN